MRALIAPEPGRLVVDEVPDPTAAPGQVLVRARVTAVSAGTELRMLHRDPAGSGGSATDPGWPAVGAFGYLASGDVVAVGEDVRGIDVGDRVACGRNWGAHREIVDVDADAVLVLPPGVDYVDGACAYWAVPPLAGIAAGAPTAADEVVVIGLGPLGLTAVQVLARSVRRVIGVDLVAARCAAAERFGALAVDASAGDPIAELRRLLPDGPRIVIQAAGSQPALELALAVVRPNGVVVNVGTLPRLSNFDLFWPMQLSGASVLPIARPAGVSGSVELGTALRREHLPRVFDDIARGTLDIRGLCTWVLPIESAPDAMRLLRRHPDRALGLAFAWAADEVVGAADFAAVRPHSAAGLRMQD